MANNEGSRVDQLEATIKLMAEQLQALTTAVTKNAAPQTTEAESSTRGRPEPRNRIVEDILNLDDNDDTAEYTAGRVANSQLEFQKLKEHVETVTQKMNGKHEDLLDYEAMIFEEQLPPQFKMPDMAKFNWNGDPRVHLRQYLSLMSSAGLSKCQVLRMFGMSLEGAPVVWYHGLEKKTKDDWKALAEAFLNQYVTDLEINLSLWDLENTKQKPDESFKDYVDRWRGQLLKM